MKEIKRYSLSGLKNGVVNIQELMSFNDKTEFAIYAEIEQLQARIKELESEKNLAYQQGKNDVCDLLKAFISGDAATKMAIMEKLKN